MNGTGSDLCPMAGIGVGSVEYLDSAAAVQSALVLAYFTTL
jgi:hypothetical protein